MWIIIFFQLSVIAKDYYLYKNDEKVIETFSQFGIILSANITYQSQLDQPCQIKPQKLSNKNYQELLLIPQYKESIFKELYQDGQLISNMNYLVSLIQIKNEAIILDNQGQLIHLKQNNDQYQIQSHQTLSINIDIFSKPVYMLFMNNTQELLLILNGQTIKLKININQTNIFGESCKIYDVFLTEQIKSIAYIEDLLFVATGEFGLHVYKSAVKSFEQLPCTIQFTNITDLRIFQENKIFYIFALDYDIGVKVITFNAITSQFYENKQFSDIPYKGEIIDLYNQVLMVVEQKDTESIIHELQISYQNNSWRLIHQHKAQKYIQDIEMTEHYAFIIGRNGHEIIYHSLPSYELKLQDKIIIPGLQKLYFLNQDNNTQILGITKHLFFSTKLQLLSQSIQCAYSYTTDEIQFTYYQNSTLCPNTINQSKICHYKQNYTLHFIHPILTTEESIYIYIITALIIFVFILMLLLLIKEFRQYSFFVHSQIPKGYVHQPSASGAQTQDIYALNSFDSPMKVNKQTYANSNAPSND